MNTNTIHIPSLLQYKYECYSKTKKNTANTKINIICKEYSRIYSNIRYTLGLTPVISPFCCLFIEEFLEKRPFWCQSLVYSGGSGKLGTWFLG